MYSNYSRMYTYDSFSISDQFWTNSLILPLSSLFCPSLFFSQIPHVKIGPEETPRLPYLRFASVTLYPSNEDLSLAVGAILRSFSYPSASLVCAKAECESLIFALSISMYDLPRSSTHVKMPFQMSHRRDYMATQLSDWKIFDVQQVETFMILVWIINVLQ